MPTTTAGSIVKQEKEKKKQVVSCLSVCVVPAFLGCVRVIINNPLGLYLFCAHVYFFTDGIVWTISPSYLSAASIFFTFEIRSHWIPIKREKQTEIYNLLMLLVYYDDDYLFDRRSTPLNGYARNELTYQLRTIPAAAAAAVFLQRGFFIFLCYLQARKIIHQKNKTKCT